MRRDPDHRHHRLLRARRKRPHRRSDKRGDEFSPSDVACHLTLPLGAMPCNGWMISPFDGVVCDCRGWSAYLRRLSVIADMLIGRHRAMSRPEQVQQMSTVSAAILRLG